VEPPTTGPSRKRDEELLEDARKGVEAAFHELMDRHAAGLYRLAWRLVGNASDAEEIVQETFMGAFRQMSGFRGEASVKTWLSRIAVRQAAAHHRSAFRRKAVPLQTRRPDEEWEREPRSREADSESVGRRLDVRRAVDRLSPEHREIIVLREFEGMSYSEMAEALGVPQGTVESRLHRARLELRSLLKDYLV
jgi:RNA polymerase sigma-70 factor (ECF subfamily)